MVYKRLALVDPRLVLKNNILTNDEHGQEHSAESEQILEVDRKQVYKSLQKDAPLIEVIIQAQQEINTALNDETLPLDERMVNYQKALNKHQLLLQKYQRGSLADIEHLSLQKPGQNLEIGRASCRERV